MSRLLGLVREPVIAALFGVGGTVDALEIATRIPQFMHELVIGGAVSGALIPVFSQLAGNDQALRRTFSTVIATVIAIAGVATAILVLLAEPLVDLAAIGLPPETRELAVTLTRITLPSLLFLGISAVTTARLYARDRYAFPAFSTASLNGTLIVFALALTPVVGPPGVALGYLAGAGMHLVVQLPALVRDRASLSPPAWLSDSQFHQILRLYAPVSRRPGGSASPRNRRCQSGFAHRRRQPGNHALCHAAATVPDRPGGNGALASLSADPCTHRPRVDSRPGIGDGVPRSAGHGRQAFGHPHHPDHGPHDRSQHAHHPRGVRARPVRRRRYECHRTRVADLRHPASAHGAGSTLHRGVLRHAEHNHTGRRGHPRRRRVSRHRPVAGRAARHARPRDRQHRPEQLSRTGAGARALVAHAGLDPARQLGLRDQGVAGRRRDGADRAGVGRGHGCAASSRTAAPAG